LLVGACLLAALELAALVVVHARWQRARRRARRFERELDRLLEQQLERGRERRWSPGRLPTTRDAVRAVWETAALVREKGVSGALQHSIDDLAGWAQVERPDLDRLAAGDGSVAILFSDIEGSTALNDELGDKQWLKVLGRHDAVVRRCVEAHDGHVIKTQGDGFMVAFGPAENAVDCAVAIQRAFAPGRQRRGPQIRIRIGIHRGEAVRRDGDLFGRNVAYAARVAGLAEGGEILVSDAVVAAMADRLDDDDPPFLEGRDVELKGLAGAHRVHTVAWEKDAEDADEANAGVIDS
jgi:class 3 adenylate cyclase